MRLPLLSLLPALAGVMALTLPASAQERQIVEASEPVDVAVTIYRDPNRRLGQEMNADYPRGFAMISETRRVDLPPGQSTIRFEGVAEGMVAVSAIVTGLPGGTIEKNRNADLLSPASLVDGTLGNRVRITRTNPGTGEAESENAIVRTRADGGLVLQTSQGYEAVRCSGLPESLTFNQVPDGLSAQPVFTIDTSAALGGRYTITLTYLSWGFDWEANYVATLPEGGSSDELSFDMLSWLTLLNDNGQSFEDAELLVVAGTLNVESDFQQLADSPQARSLSLTCYPIGSTAAGSPVPNYADQAIPPPPLPPPVSAPPGAIMVTAMRREQDVMESPVAVTVMEAVEEQLGDLKLYRVPVPVDVNAQGMKQVAFLNRQDVEGRLLYESGCVPWGRGEPTPVPAQITLQTENDEEHGLGVALPAGRMMFYERSPAGTLLVGEDSLRDYASGQDVELQLGASTQVFGVCVFSDGREYDPDRWNNLRLTLTNANPVPVTVRVSLGDPRSLRVQGIESELKDGRRVTEVSVPANGERRVDWQVRAANN